MKNSNPIEIAKRMQAMAQTGLTYTENSFDIERYQELRELSTVLLQQVSQQPLPLVKELFAQGKGYPTPMVDVRAVVFNPKGKMLLVKEKADGCYTPPGGWADVGYTPFEVAVKETKEEAGLNVKPIRLLGVFDKKCHSHPPQHYYVYKIIVLCDLQPGQEATAADRTETTDVGWYGPTELPELSADRITPHQMHIIFAYFNHPDKLPFCD